MTDSLLPLTSAMIAAMKAYAPLTAIVGQRIYGDVPDNPTFPFVVLNINSSPYDTKTGVGMEHAAQVSIFSRKPSMSEVGSIRSTVYNLFHNQESTLSSASVDSIMFTGLAPVFKDPDGQTWQGVIQFRIVIGD